MNLQGIRRVKELAVRLTTRPGAEAVILAYHRVADVASDPWGIAVSPRHFAEQLDALRRRRPVLSMRELVERLGDGTLPHGAVALTFDDGYLDNLLNAKPLLERYDVPATVFVASGYLGTKRPFWWDRLRHLLLEPGTLPRKLSLAVNSLWFERDLGADAAYDEASFARDRKWRVGVPPPTARHEAYQSLWQILRPLSDERQTAVLDEIAAWAGAGGRCRKEERAISEEELAALMRSGLVDIGAHTVTHPLLSAMAESAQYREIDDCQKTLERIVGERVTCFAYPYGDHSPATASIVARLGFAAALTTEREPASGQSLRFHLPRVIADDLDGDAFSAWLDGQFSAA